jgi:spermidine synthase
MASRTRTPSVEIVESRGVRSLHLGGAAIQSRQRLDRPWELALAYTRAMSACLMLHPRPREVLMIGLGGGSLATFILRHTRAPRVTAVEIHPQVVAAARSMFGLPPDGPRLRVRVADGAEHVAAHPESADVILLDAYLDGRQAERLASGRFYRQARAALRAGGILVVNCIADEPALPAYLECLGAVFGGRLLYARTPPDDNIVVFAFDGALPELRSAALVRRAQALASRTGIGYPALLRRLRPAQDWRR